MQNTQAQKSGTNNNFNTWVDSIYFTNIGPTVMGGRAIDLSVNPKKNSEFLVAYASGGLFYTNNNGQSFTPIFENQIILNIGAIAVDWESKKIWIGTGEANSSRSSYAGKGVFFSDDWGKTWQQRGLIETQHIGRMAIDPNNKNKIIVAALGNLYSKNSERGVFITEDNGINWKQTLYIDDSTGIIDVAIDPLDSYTIYATAWHRQRFPWNFIEAGFTSAIYKSVNGGFKWEKITGENTGFPQNENIGRIGIAVSHKTKGLIYASVDNQNTRKIVDPEKVEKFKGYSLNDFKTISKDSFLLLKDNYLDSFILKTNLKNKYTSQQLKNIVAKDSMPPNFLYNYFIDANAALFSNNIIGLEIYQSSNGGKNWQKVNEKYLPNYNTYGYYFGRIDIAAEDDSMILVHGFNLLKSENGGKTFNKTDNENTHPDWHGAWINQTDKNHWIAVNDGGCNITYDMGKNWFKVVTPAVSQAYAITTDNKEKYNIYCGLQDNGTWYGTHDNNPETDFEYENGSSWKRLNGGDGMQIKIGKGNYIYSGYQFGFYNRFDMQNKKDTSIRVDHNLGEPHFRYNWQTPILVSNFDSSVVYYGANKLFALNNDGLKTAWQTTDLTQGAKTGDVPYGTLTCMAESKFQKGLIYTGSDDGKIYKINNNGIDIEDIGINIITNNMPLNLHVSKIVSSVHDNNKLLVALSGYKFDDFKAYIFLSENKGATWQAINTNLPNSPINTIVEHPTNKNEFFVGTDNGLYITKDNGMSYQKFKNLPSVAVHDLVIQSVTKDLLIGTHGRSVYKISLTNLDKKYNKIMEQQAKLYPAKFDKNKTEGEDIDCPPAQPKKNNKKKNLTKKK